MIAINAHVAKARIDFLENSVLKLQSDIKNMTGDDEDKRTPAQRAEDGRKELAYWKAFHARQERLADGAKSCRSMFQVPFVADGADDRAHLICLQAPSVAFDMPLGGPRVDE